jgi:hypothetical protein
MTPTSNEAIFSDLDLEVKVTEGHKVDIFKMNFRYISKTKGHFNVVLGEKLCLYKARLTIGIFFLRHAHKGAHLKKEGTHSCNVLARTKTVPNVPMVSFERVTKGGLRKGLCRV